MIVDDAKLSVQVQRIMVALRCPYHCREVIVDGTRLSLQVRRIRLETRGPSRARIPRDFLLVTSNSNQHL